MTKRELIQFMDELVELASEENKTRAILVKEKFINEVLDVVKKISGHTEYGLGNRLFEELRVRESEPETNARQAEEVKFFMAANKVFSALSQKTQYYPPYSVLANAENIRELAEIYYRRGQF